MRGGRGSARAARACVQLLPPASFPQRSTTEAVRCGHFRVRHAYTIVVSVTVGVRELRGNLRAFLDRVESGEEVVVTERGKAIARITPVVWKTTLERLIEEGLVTPPSEPKLPLHEPIPVRGSVMDVLLEERRGDH